MSTERFAAAMSWRDRKVGRPALASKALRETLYRDENGRRQMVAELKPWHERIVDVLICNPGMNQRELARHFDKSESWMSLLMNSDSFKEYYRMRMAAHQEYLSAEITQKMSGVAVTALETMETKIKAGAVPFGQIVEAAGLTLKSLGFGVQPALNVNIKNEDKSVTVLGVSKEELEKARERIAQKRALNSQMLEEHSSREDYMQVTASLDVDVVEGVEDAVIVETVRGEEE